ncbi:MAG: thioredoxin [Chitinivibrionia bacterium]|nr:thioredoxin [Chitinivibrionia bacterium]
MAQAVNDENFEAEVLNSNVPVLADFWAEWCGPCRMLSPIMDELTGLVGDKAKIVKVNVDECPQTAAKYAISAIPTTIVFENGADKVSKTGVFPKSEYLKMLGL